MEWLIRKIDDIEIKLIQNFDLYFDEIRKFCIQAMKNSKHKQTRLNMDGLLYKTNTSSLLYKLFIAKEYKSICLAYHKSKLIATCALEDFGNNKLMMRRFFVLRTHRSFRILHDHMFPAIIDFARKHKFTHILISVNDYRYGLAKMIMRKSKQFPLYQNFELLPGKQIIQHVEQSVLELKL